MPTWPTTLPSPDRSGYSEKPKSNLLLSSPDMGAQKRRRRFTATPTAISFSLQLSGAETTTLVDFFHTECKDGSLTFTFTSPRTGSTLYCRFANDYTPEVKNLNGDRWAVSVELESLP